MFARLPYLRHPGTCSTRKMYCQNAHDHSHMSNSTQARMYRPHAHAQAATGHSYIPSPTPTYPTPPHHPHPSQTRLTNAITNPSSWCGDTCVATAHSVLSPAVRVPRPPRGAQLRAEVGQSAEAGCHGRCGYGREELDATRPRSCSGGMSERSLEFLVFSSK